MTVRARRTDAGTDESARATSKLSLAEAELVALGDEVREIAGGRRTRVRFPPRLEALFERESQAARDRRLVARVLLAAILYDLFVFTDMVMTPDVVVEAAIIRLLIFTPAALLFLWVTTRAVTSRRTCLSLC